MAYIHSNGIVSGHTARASTSVFTVNYHGKTYQFNSVDEALAFQRKHRVRPSIPSGDYHDTSGTRNPGTVRTVITYNPGENPGYSYTKQEQNTARMFAYGKECYYYR